MQLCSARDPMPEVLFLHTWDLHVSKSCRGVIIFVCLDRRRGFSLNRRRRLWHASATRWDDVKKNQTQTSFLLTRQVFFWWTQERTLDLVCLLKTGNSYPAELMFSSYLLISLCAEAGNALKECLIMVIDLMLHCKNIACWELNNHFWAVGLRLLRVKKLLIIQPLFL